MLGLPHLAKAPIVEAVFDIRAEGAGAFSNPNYGLIAETEKGQYPNQVAQIDFEVVAEFASAGTSAARQQSRQIGFLLRSADGRQLVQVGERGLSLNRLAPYTSWGSLRPEVLRLWQLYRDSFPQSTCTRVAIRTINYIQLNDDSGYKDVLTVPPTMPSHFGLRPQSFSIRHEMVDDKSGLRIILHQASAATAPTQNRAILLDIDVFQDPPIGTRPDDVAMVFDRIHDVKNRIFQGSVVENWLVRYQ